MLRPFYDLLVRFGAGALAGNGESNDRQRGRCNQAPRIWTLQSIDLHLLPSQDSEASYRINEDQVRGLLRPGNSTPLMTARGQTRLFGDVDVRCPKATTGRFMSTR